MKPPAFDYLQVDTVSEAYDAWQSRAGDAVYLAGGHSIVPSLALRLQAPSMLIDISRIAELQGVELHDGWLRVGAMTRHVEVMHDVLIASHAQLLQLAAPHVAHPAIRNRGTIGGSISLADPAAEFPAAVLALRAEMEVAGPHGVRRIPADKFFVDIYETAMDPGEILIAVHIPPVVSGEVQAFDELVRRRGDYAMVGCAIQGVNVNGILSDISIAFFSVGSKPTRAQGAEAALQGCKLDDMTIAAAQRALINDLNPLDEPTIPAHMRIHLARVLFGRLLAQMGEQS